VLFLIFSLGILFFPLPVAGGGEEVTLDQALALFYKNNYDLLISRYEMDKAYADYVGAKLRPNPTVSFNAIGMDYYSGYPKRDDTTQMTVRIDQLIELGGKRELRTNVALATQQAVSLSYKDVIRNLLIGFYTVYYNLELDRLNLQFGRDELGRFDRILDIAERRFNAGFLTQLDHTKIKLAKVDLENNLTNFEAQFRKDLENFNFLVGVTAQLEPSRLVIREEFPAYQEESLIEVAYQNRYDLLAAQKQTEAARHNMALARALRIPDLSVGAEHDSFGADGASRIGGGVSIGIPVFNRAQGAILRSNAEYKQLEEQVKKIKRVIVSDVRQGLISYRASVTVLGAFKERKASMEDLLNKSEAAFSLGGITVLDLLDTRKTYRDFVTKYNQNLIQTLLNQELLKVFTGEVK
jgi:outer membrane protein, heavy metal efflux system